MNVKSFKKTGRNMQVSRDYLINATIELLMKYDSLSPEQRKSISNPYNSPVHTQLTNGKHVQVPRYIQHDAII